MGYTLTEKILRQHLADGFYEPGKEIGIKIDQTLTQDATGTMAYLQFESMGLSDIATELSVSYVDHNTIQVGFENADDHAYLESIAKKYGIYFSREIRTTRQNPAGLRQPHTHRRRRGLSGHGRRRT
jgi:aconitate hydratase